MIVPGDPAQRTGGYLYDQHIVRQLRDLGWSVEVIGLEGRFPDADDLAARAMHRALSGLPDGAAVVIDGLALGGLPDAVAAHAGRLDISALVHHPLADETGLDAGVRDRLLARETRSLEACRRVIVTSPFTARRLRELGLDPRTPRVVEPGVDKAETAEPVAERLQGREPKGPERLLCVASLTPRKGQDVLVRALAQLTERDWHCILAGSDTRDAGFAGRVADLIREAGLIDGIDCIGECDENALEAEYRRAGLCLLPSHYEGYGMVVGEALARGLPMITTTGGALAQTAPDDCCLRVEPADADALRDALAQWLDDAGLRRRLTGNAVARREHLRSWSQAGREFAAALEGDRSR
ncbi:glycosyltransferase [Wenzhouxiangella sp. 15181]|nr:glycosyltransferase [Wenzhouxiangella sp. 15181]RFP69636.1 glycosyltransferase [Wenzhouxiangella sp. 15190]